MKSTSITLLASIALTLTSFAAPALLIETTITDGNNQVLSRPSVIISSGKQATIATGDSISLAQAVNDFNERHHAAVAAKQADLTIEAVLVAVRWAMGDRAKLSVTNETFAALGRMIETQVLPKEFELELLTGYQLADTVTFDVWSVRLRIPGTVIPGGTTCIFIHEQMLGSRVIGEEERKVIHAWREKERKQGGIGSFELWRQESEESDAAAAIDARNQKPAK